MDPGTGLAGDTTAAMSPWAFAGKSGAGSDVKDGNHLSEPQRLRSLSFKAAY